ncbi:MAG: WD40 repeat domain-containing protein [Lachnospiraceae bacterium]|nr:WD40 repeat domain-containing protein [Lachnospiraceae bacterium]
MEDQCQTFIWSDGWWLEGDQAWFVDGWRNILFYVDLKCGECKKVSDIPSINGWKYRENPYCVKWGTDIYCIPGCRDRIWIYSLDNNAFTKLDIVGLEQHQWGNQVWVWGSILFIVVGNGNKIIEVDLNRRVIVNCYIICEDDNIIRSVLAEKKIYALSSEYNRIYQFDLLTKEVKTYMLPGIKKRLFTICFDGEKFWFSGYHKEVYTWDKEKNKCTIIRFPENFNGDSRDKKIESVADNCELPVFSRAVAVGGYIWFIPFHAENKIIYIDKETARVYAFEIFEEDKVSILIKKPWGIADYLLEYVRDDRYIGLFSANNSRILEIDTKQLVYQWKKYYFSEQYLRQYYEERGGIYYEGYDPVYIHPYHMSNQAVGFRTDKTDFNSIGMKIHARLIKGIYNE